MRNGNNREKLVKKENDIETVVRDPAKCHNAFAAWAVIYNTASSVPGALLVHYFKDRCWCLGLHSGIFLRNGWFGNRGIQVLFVDQ